ncbi:N-formylglutamate amidohydrolase [Sphingobium boeckii]|uniref:Putative N-formylglutamate amidohydrolase n=1 Tax=Sphingobium boeckii TaxID=1082345 RepID=A0A7W9AIM5_9SPHN|nr:N-formylglutamate amidohydrolase [Sphingobium boeckii]MBB5686369.1 putative N-formylglutamate amidohydrolase [Sphingobium boeckii]
MAVGPLLSSGDPEPVEILNRSGPSPFLLIVDHAGKHVPARLNGLDLAPSEFDRHIACDIGARDLALSLSAVLDATLVMQRYSRLVIDCNRDPSRVDAIPALSDGTLISANARLSAEDRAHRIHAIHAPYHQAITGILDERTDRETVLVALHSFTPVLAGEHRPWHVGILHADGIPDYARRLLSVLRLNPDMIIGDNEPYHMDETDFTVPFHAWARNLPYAEIEIRQDLLTAERRDHIVAWMARALCDALNSGTTGQF